MIRSVLQKTAIGMAMFVPTLVHTPIAETRPVIAVWYFDNNSIGKDARDYDGVGKGIQDLVTTDLASNGKVRIVDRSRIEQLLQEQNLAKTGAVDPETAVKLGKILGACYSITGGFMSDGKGTMVLTGRTINVETSAIGNPVKVQSKDGDALGLIAQLTAKLSGDLKLEGCPTGGTRTGSAAPAPTPAATQQAATKAPAPAPAGEVAQYKAEISQAQVDKINSVKLDFRTELLYSKGLDAEDHHDNAKAKDLFKQVLAKAPGFQEAKDHMKKVDPTYAGN